MGNAARRAPRAETRAAVRGCIDRLPERYRIVLLLCDNEDLDTVDTASTISSLPHERSVVTARVRGPRGLPIVAALLLLAALPARGAIPDAPEQAEVLAELARARFGQLTAAERMLVRGAPSRELAWVGPSSDPDDPTNDPTRGAEWGPERGIREGILRWLYTDAEASRFLDASGLGVAGARIDGKLDLSYVKGDKPLTIVSSYIPDGIDVSFSHLQSLEVRRSSTGPIVADMSEVAGDLAFRFGTYGPLSLFRARIGGNLDCTGSTLRGSGQQSVNAIGAVIAGDMVFHDGFTTEGIVDLRLAHVGQSLSFHHATFSGTDDTGLDAERASIGGTLYWVEIEHTPTTELDLENTKADALWDDEASWPAPGKLVIDGFTYTELAGGPADAEPRLRWLGRQPAGYRPQPYRQLAKVLHDGGRETGATDVLIAKEELRRREGGLGRLERAWNLMLDLTIGYGYRPLRALWWIAGFVILGTFLFGLGYRARLVTPTDDAAYRVFVESGVAPPHHPPFHALVYALENFLPVVDLDQGEFWRPNPVHGLNGRAGNIRVVPARLLRWYLWLHILAGWTLTPLLFAGLSGLVHPD